MMIRMTESEVFKRKRTIAEWLEAMSFLSHSAIVLFIGKRLVFRNNFLTIHKTNYFTVAV